MSKIKEKWAFARNDPNGRIVIFCNRCGEECSPDLPIAVYKFVSLTNAFMRLHTRCKNKPVLPRYGVIR